MAKIKLSDIPTTPPKKLEKEAVKEATDKLLEELDELQNLLYAQHKCIQYWVVLQGMDASGKDGLIPECVRQAQPPGRQRLQAFKAPTEDELEHDFLWRIHQHIPAKGMIQIFNRSHYEDVLVQRGAQMGER